ncbi:hypothetical protein [Nocardiopsis sp. FR26]|uniref:hypothetical protein n=1 Tax=Nocardiopsis sp. FR26 TaxID=2605987 RepID=UPI00135B2F73|nr:hypothetical protein [Nocardiopsis sp. FR26]
MRSSPEEIRAAVLALLKGDVEGEYDKARAVVGAELMEGDRHGIALPGPDGEPVKVGTVHRPEDTTTVLVDERKALAWLQEHMPHEVAPAPRPGALERLQKEIERYGGVLVRGEIVPVDWAEVQVKPAAARVYRPTKGAQREAAKAAVFTAFERGDLSLSALLAPQLEAGESPPEV